MKLIELIEQGIDYDDILYHDNWALGVRMCKDLGDAFVYCDPISGEFTKIPSDYTGYKRVILCKKILDDDMWNKRQITEKNEYPNNRLRIQPLESGYVMYISSQKPVKIGDQYENYPAFISRIIYEPKKWWQFWKRKKQIGYEVALK